jgi:hypothetical protein
MDVITPLNNLPNLKQGQNVGEVALEIYGIILDVTAHLPAPKETAVSSLFLDSAVIIDCHRNCSHKVVVVDPLYLLLLYLTNVNSLFFWQKLWRIVIDCFFGAGKPGALFKRPANVYTLHDIVMASTEFRARQATGPGVHSSSNNRDD